MTETTDTDVLRHKHAASNEHDYDGCLCSDAELRARYRAEVDRVNRATEAEMNWPRSPS